MKKLLLASIIFYFTSVEAQVASTFMETTTICDGLTIDENFLYVISEGKLYRKVVTSTDNTFESFNIGGSGYSNITKMGNFVYITKPSNGPGGVYRFNPDAIIITPQSYVAMSSVHGIAHRNSELYFGTTNKIYKVNTAASTPVPVIIANNILGSSTAGYITGLKVYGDYLYVAEKTGISKINLVSGNYEKEKITAFTGTSFTIADNNKMYLTNELSLSGVYELDLQTNAYTFLNIPNFIGSFDIVSFNNFLFVTAKEGDYRKVAKIDLSILSVGDIKKTDTHIFPNPADNFVNIVGQDSVESVEIINQNGQIKSVNVKNNRIDVSDLTSGIYFIKTKDWTEKFIKK